MFPAFLGSRAGTRRVRNWLDENHRRRLGGDAVVNRDMCSSVVFSPCLRIPFVKRIRCSIRVRKGISDGCFKG